jgi:hypothetical protein
VDKVNRVENMARLKELGYSYAAIGALYGVSRQRVHQLISGYYRNCASLKHENGWYRRIHNMVIKRDSGKCQKCAEEKNLVVHHLDGNVNNNKFSNLITLCNQCHLNLHRPNGQKTSPTMPQIGEAITMITEAGNEP